MSSVRDDGVAAVGLIAGTGFDDIMLDGAAVDFAETPYGPVDILRGTWHVPLVFAPRHGAGHALPPHLVNYRGIIWALRELGCRDVFAINVVGGTSADLGPGSLVVVDDFLDFTRIRECSFSDPGGEDPARYGSDFPPPGFVHTDSSQPYHPDLRAELLAAAEAVGEPMVDGGVYACFEGPRFETRAEIRMARQLGADVVGMTTVPEVCLAAEAGMRYASISVVTNPATGVLPGQISSAEIDAVLERSRTDVLAVLNQVLATRAGLE